MHMNVNFYSFKSGFNHVLCKVPISVSSGSRPPTCIHSLYNLQFFMFLHSICCFHPPPKVYFCDFITFIKNRTKKYDVGQMYW